VSGDVLYLQSLDAHALWAESYDHHANPLLALEERTIAPMLDRLSPSFALDLACGTGRWLQHLGRRGIAAAGLDLSPEMLRKAQKKGMPTRSLIRADCKELPLRSECADFAICSFALGYVADLRGFAREASRVIHDNGHLLISDLHPAAAARGWKRRFRHNSTVVEIAHIVHPLDCIATAFAAAGFRLSQMVEPGFGEPDRAVFERSGKGELFEEAAGVSAIFVRLFQRTTRGAPDS
jgi:ubiquinone/menaquinone biosynthesis C-methylase UbiE